MDTIKLSYSHLGGNYFQALIKRLKTTQHSFDNAQLVKKLCRVIFDASKKIEDEYTNDIINNFGDKDEAGKVTVDYQKEPERGFSVAAAKLNDYNLAEIAFGNRIIELEFEKFRLDRLSALKSISPNEIELLEPFLKDTL